MIRLFTLCCLFCLKTIAQPLPSNYILGRTTGSLPFLLYGLGEDRLGGAKMTFLDTMIMMKVIDSAKEDYEVQLSKFHNAWLPKINFKADNLLALRPYYLTDSWKVY